MMAIFDFLGSIFGYLLYAAFFLVNNFGVAIIIFTLIFKILLFPSSVKQQKSMAANSKLQKKQQELKEKYGNDKQKYNEEVQKLYNKEGASPFGGCLTSLLPMFVMLGIYRAVARPISNVLHIASEKVDAIWEVANKFPGVSISTQSYYKEIDVLRLFNNPNTFSIMQDKLGSSIAGDEMDKIHSLSGGFNFLGFDLLSTPRTEGFLSIAMLIPVLCLLTSVGTQIYMMKKQGSMTGQQGCMKYMLLALPLFTAYIAYTVPCAVGFYWIFSNIIGFVQSMIMYKFWSPAMVTARKEGAHIALLEQQEAKVEYDYNPVVVPSNDNRNQKGKKKKK